MSLRPVLVICSVLCLSSELANAQGAALTLGEVLARARDQAPRIVSARAALDEARGRLLGASLRLQANPEVDAAVGNRQRDEGATLELDLGLAQTFEPRSRRSARMDAANALIASGQADVDETIRGVLRDAASAYYRALHATGRARMLAAAQELATGISQVADRRFRSGDIPILEVNIARASLARARAEREAAAAMYAQATGELRQLLRIEGELAVEGDLGTLDRDDLAMLLQSADQRPELQMLKASVDEAEAEMRLGDSFLKPEYGLGVRYAREERNSVLLGGLTITLPVFSKGQELRVVGSARAARLRYELEAGRERVRLEVRSAFETYGRRVAAVRILEADALPGLDENETLTTRSFEVGQIGLSELLIIRHEILDTRFQHLDALLEAALARIELDASAAILR